LETPKPAYGGAQAKACATGFLHKKTQQTQSAVFLGFT
jgi:hypothetical protein